MSERGPRQAPRRRAGAIARSIAALVGAGCLAAPAWAQQRTPDPAAQAAYRTLVKELRSRAPFEVKSSLVVEAIEGEQRRAAPPVESVMRFDPRSTPRRAVLSINGFEVLVADGKLFVHHGSNEREYVEIEDDGSPYYALLSTFADLPYPHIGMLLGEEDPDEVLPQITSRTAWIAPTKIESIEADAEKGTPALRRLHLTSDYEDLQLELDAAKPIIRSMRLRIGGGPMVQPGTELEIRVTCEETELAEPDAAKAFAFDPGERRRIDAIVALPRLADAAGGGAGGGGGVPSLVGQRAPAIGLQRFDDGDFDLANFRGRKVVVIDFWATWCAPCRAALPQLDQVAREFERRGAPVVVAAINTLEGLEGEELRRKVGAFWKDKNLSMVLALDEDGKAAEEFGVRGIPATFVVGLDGVIAWEHMGLSESYAEQLTKAIEKALQPAGGAEEP